MPRLEARFLPGSLRPPAPVSPERQHLTSGARAERRETLHARVTPLRPGTRQVVGPDLLPELVRVHAVDPRRVEAEDLPLHLAREGRVAVLLLQLGRDLEGTD